MKRKGKIAIIVIVSILLAVGIVAGTMAGCATRALDETSPTSLHRQWMSYIEDDAQLVNMVIPGAHDAGSNDMMWAAETQDKSIKEMLYCGVRYFDVRVNNLDDELVIFHGPINGDDFEPIIDDVASFLQDYPSETVILDFQHFKGDDVMQRVNDVLLEKLADKMLVNDSKYDDLSFIKSLSLSDARGKAIVFWGSSDFVGDKNYLFLRNDDEGNREGSALHSFYTRSLNTKTSKHYLEEAIDEYVDKFCDTNGGFFVMQCQLTDPIFIIGPKFLESTHTKNVSNFVESLKDKPYFNVVNIIMRDYMGTEKSNEIIYLNVFKGYVLKHRMTEFNEGCGK